MVGATQNERVLELLRFKGDLGLSPIEALDEVGSLRLAARIADVKATMLGEDEEIVTLRATSNGKTYARYVLRRRETPGIRQETIW